MWLKRGTLVLGNPGVPGHRSPEAPVLSHPSLQRTLDCSMHCPPPCDRGQVTGSSSFTPGITGLGSRKHSELWLQLRFLRPRGLAEATSEPMFPEVLASGQQGHFLPLRILPRLLGSEAPGPPLHTGSYWVASSVWPPPPPSFPQHTVGS